MYGLDAQAWSRRGITPLSEIIVGDEQLNISLGITPCDAFQSVFVLVQGVPLPDVLPPAPPGRLPPPLALRSGLLRRQRPRLPSQPGAQAGGRRRHTRRNGGHHMVGTELMWLKS